MFKAIHPASLLHIFLLLISLAETAYSQSSCTGAISSLDDVADAVACTTVNIDSFTVTAGKSFSLSLLEGTTVNVCMCLALVSTACDDGD